MIAEMPQGRDLPDALSAGEAVDSRDFEETWVRKVNTIDLTEMCTLSADVCGREPIHLSSAIQPHGVLIGLDAKTLGLVTNSANVDAIFGDAPLDERPAWLPQSVIAACRDLGQGSGEERTMIEEMPGLGSTEVHCFAASGIVFCEFERPATSPIEPFNRDGAQLIVTQAIKDMEAAKDLSELAAIVAQSVRAVSGFERVMVYRFEFDGDGEVVGESLAEDWDQSFLRLRFPASDINQFCLLGVGYAQVSVLDGVDKKLMQPVDGSLRFREAICNIGCEIFRFIQGPKAKTGIDHQAKNASISSN